MIAPESDSQTSSNTAQRSARNIIGREWEGSPMTKPEDSGASQCNPESSELDLNQQEDLALEIILPTERSDIPFVRTSVPNSSG